MSNTGTWFCPRLLEIRGLDLVDAVRVEEMWTLVVFVGMPVEVHIKPWP